MQLPIKQSLNYPATLPAKYSTTTYYRSYKQNYIEETITCKKLFYKAF